MKTVKSLEGTIVGKLTVTGEYRYNSKGNIQWKCLCSCGEYTWVLRNNLTRNHTRSCGSGWCKYVEDVTGNRYGRLTVLRYVKQHVHRQTMWLCICDCGNYHIVSYSKLKLGTTRSCGCLMVENMQRISSNQAGHNHPNFNPALTDEDRELSKRRSTEYLVWRFKVLVRDNFKCIKCGSLAEPHVHHIEAYSLNKDKRMDINNAATLCRECHRMYHSTYGLSATVDTFLKFTKGDDHAGDFNR